ncbi:MAG: hypothetical protein WCW25_01360 [Patescibacteria group bacterium]|jgi:hypothetical protein
MVQQLIEQYRPPILAGNRIPAPLLSEAMVDPRHLQLNTKPFNYIEAKNPLKPDTVLTVVMETGASSRICDAVASSALLQAHEARVVYVDGICCLVPEGTPNNLNKGFGEDRRFGHFWQGTGAARMKLRQTGWTKLSGHLDLRRDGNVDGR